MYVCMYIAASVENSLHTCPGFPTRYGQVMDLHVLLHRSFTVVMIRKYYGQ